MKYVTASEARKNWFQLLDEAVCSVDVDMLKQHKLIVPELR